MIEYKVATKSEYILINDFYNRIHKTNRTIEQFNWEFNEGPKGNGIYIYAWDTEEKQVVGTQGAILLDVVDQEGTKILTAKSEDTLVDPNYRGKNIFNNMYDMLFEKCIERGVFSIWGFTTAIKPFIKMGFEVPWSHSQTLIVNKIIPAYKHLVSLNPANNLKSKIKIFGLVTFSKLTSFKVISKKINGFEIIKNQELGVENLLMTIIKSDSKPVYCLDQNAEYQKWRMFNNPHFYKVESYSIYKDKAVYGTFVANITKENTAYISQSILSSNLTSNEKTEFIQYCTSALFKSGITVIRNWNFNHTKYNQDELNNYIKSGYIHLERGVPFVWKKLNENKLNPENFIVFRTASEGTI